MNWVEKLQNNQVTLWKKYSQSCEEAYLEDILYHIQNISSDIDIVELGAWDGFHLSNSRYFIEKGYKALLIDGDNHGNQEVKKHFITKENVLEVLSQYNTPERFNLFCIDLDGNDIYIMEQVLSKYKPSIIIAEFNPIWNEGESMAIQYDADHFWNNDDYYGFSFSAGIKLAQKFGYTCIFQNDNLNMYFVENEVLAESLSVKVEELPQYIPQVAYQKTNYHPHSNKTSWVQY